MKDDFLIYYRKYEEKKSNIVKTSQNLYIYFK